MIAIASSAAGKDNLKAVVVMLISRSEKLEKARARAIYGADHKHYDIFTYVSGGGKGLDDRLNKLDTESRNEADIVHQRV